MATVIPNQITPSIYQEDPYFNFRMRYVPQIYRAEQQEQPKKQSSPVSSGLFSGMAKSFAKKFGPKEGASAGTKGAGLSVAKLKSLAKTGPTTMIGKVSGVAAGGSLAYEGIKKGNVEKSALGGAITGWSLGGPVPAAIGAVIGGIGGAINRPKINLKTRMQGRIKPLLQGDFNQANLQELQTMVGAQATRLKQEGIDKNQPLAESLYAVQGELQNYISGGGNAGAVRNAAQKASMVHTEITGGKRDKLDDNLDMLGQAFEGRSMTHENAVFERYPWLKNYL